MGQVLVTLVLECNKILYPPFPFSDLPIEVVGLVIGQAEIREQLMFRKISKTIRELVDRERPTCTRLSIKYVDPGGVICGYDDYKVAYISPRVSIEEFQAQHIDCHQFIQADNYDAVALRDFQFTLKNPRLRLEKLEASNPLFNRHLLMENIPHPVFVRELDFGAFNPSCLLLILAFLRPRVLEKITIREGDGYQWREYEMLHFARLEQWTQAEELEMYYLFDRFPMEHARHFKRFKFQEVLIDEDKFTRIKDFLSRLNFEQCILSYDLIPFNPSLGRRVSSNETEDVFRQPIGQNLSDISTGDTNKLTKQSEAMGLILATLALTCDKSPEPPKPPRDLADLLADLPLEILGMIIERLDFREQRILRKTAKKAKLRELVRKQRPACTRLSINYQPDGIICKYIHGYDEYRVAFFSPGMEIEEFQAQNFPSHEFIQADNYEEVALRDVGVTLRNPKLRLEKLETSHTVFNRHTLMEHIHHPVFVREIDFKAFNPSCLLLILPILRPGVLRKITIRGGDRIQLGWEENPFFQQPPLQWNADQMGPVALLEQWTQAEELEMQYLFDILPMEFARHFKRLKFEDFYINQDKLDRIKNHLSEMDNFEQCTISYDSNLHLLLGRPVSRNETEDVFHQDIPGSNFYFEFICWPGDEFIVEKKRRNN